MEQPPLIDVEPEDGGKSRLSGCAGCLGKLIPLTVGFLLLSIVLMGAAWFIWGADIEKKEEGVESVEGEKKGFAGLVDKAKRAIKGEKAKPDVAEGATVTGEGGSTDVAGATGGQGASGGNAMANAVEKSTDLAESIGAEGKSPEERNRLLKEKFGHLEENRPDGGAAGEGEVRNALAGGGGADGELPAFGEGISELPVERERRGGSFGSSTGSAVVAGAKNQYQRWRGDFSTSGSDLEFEIIYQEAGGQLQFRCFVMPYDSKTAKLFQADRGDFLLSFSDETGKQLVPADKELPIPLTKMTAFEARGKVSGWVARGMVPLKKNQLSDLKSVKLDWDFDEELSDWLKELKKTRGK